MDKSQAYKLVQELDKLKGKGLRAAESELVEMGEEVIDALLDGELFGE